MANDGELLQRYAASGSEEAFSELVRRHVDLVYSAALRRTGDSHAAQDVVQLVFASLARQSARLQGRPELLSWLYTAVRFTADKIRRTELRRDARQMKALEFNDLSAASGRDPDWNRFRLVLDDALLDLGEKDRQVILIRFFQDRTFAEIGGSLGLTDDGVRKRVDRAIEKLRAALARRGITSTAAAVAAALAQPLTAAPPGLAAAAASNALTAAKLAGIVGQTLAMTSLQKILITAAVAVAFSIVVYERRQASRLQTQVVELQQSASASHLREQQARRDRIAAQAAAGGRGAGPAADPGAGPVELAAITPLEKMKGWIDRLEVSIPELQLLSADDWAQLSKQYPLDTESQARRALRGLRTTAKGRLGTLMLEALQAYSAAHAGQFPTDVSQLDPYFTVPIGREMLARYAMVAPDAVVPGMPPPTPTSRTLITERREAIVDPEYDTLASFSMEGTDIRVVGRTMDAFRGALDAYSAASGGHPPRTLDQLLPYITTPVDAEQLKEIFYDIVTSRPPGQGAGG